ncbi:MAG: hypothetical protein ACR5K9_07415 [Wolbachia sp.]
MNLLSFKCSNALSCHPSALFLSSQCYDTGIQFFLDSSVTRWNDRNPSSPYLSSHYLSLVIQSSPLLVIPVLDTGIQPFHKKVVF